MMRGENTDSIPTDLITEIFSRLPAKSVARFRCLSKLWGYILSRPYFTDLFLTRSSARPPRLLIVFKERGNDEWYFFTSPQHQNPHETSSFVVAADCHMKFSGDRTSGFIRHTSGLVSIHRKLNISEEEYVICNPSTGQFATLASPQGRRIPFSGFDPINKEFKVLSISYPRYGENQILTLGIGNNSWRKIHFPLNHYHCGYLQDGICINGFLYYIAKQTNGRFVIVCFDVRSEKFKFIHRDFLSKEVERKLINYKDKLGFITLEDNYYYSHDSMTITMTIRLCLWIMKDVENPESEWSEYVCNFEKGYFLTGNGFTGWKDHFFGGRVSIVGITATGDIALSMNCTITSVPFYVFYINPKTNTVQIVELQGLCPNKAVQVFVDYVEDLKFINTMMRYAATTIRPNSTSSKARLQFESTNTFDSLDLLEDDEFI